MSVEDESACGRCLCGRVRFALRGALRDVIVCHCLECRRWHGHVSASTAVSRSDLVLLSSETLRWIESPCSDAHARRGFCAECGSSLFWDAPSQDTVSIAAGTLDSPAGLRISEHWYVSQAADYYDLPADGAARHERNGT